ncbi:hypothetical protein GOODEAATRI_020775 [Goodea atripinnis]|uniref:Uncharacterized protein n=1 Tax=Goodea atripinnis TaxID=208336 RepID=A0ABV0NWQ0_9TELE
MTTLPTEPQSPVPCRRYRAGPVFHDRDENHTAPPEAERFDYRPDSPLQYPGTGLTREAEECDPPVVGTHPPVTLLMKGDHHPSVPVQRHCPRPPCSVEEACQP